MALCNGGGGGAGETRVCAPLFLSPQAYLGAVSYGPSGIERKATGCVVSTPHTAITCTMAEGTGRVLKWMVTVGGQTSLLSKAASSYAAPTIWAASPSHCPTQGCGTLDGAPRLVTRAYLSRGPPSRCRPHAHTSVTSLLPLLLAQ